MINPHRKAPKKLRLDSSTFEVEVAAGVRSLKKENSVFPQGGNQSLSSRIEGEGLFQKRLKSSARLWRKKKTPQGRRSGEQYTSEGQLGRRR